MCGRKAKRVGSAKQNRSAREASYSWRALISCTSSVLRNLSPLRRSCARSLAGANARTRCAEAVHPRPGGGAAASSRAAAAWIVPRVSAPPSDPTTKASPVAPAPPQKARAVPPKALDRRGARLRPRIGACSPTPNASQTSTRPSPLVEASTYSLAEPGADPRPLAPALPSRETTASGTQTSSRTGSRWQKSSTCEASTMLSSPTSARVVSNSKTSPLKVPTASTDGRTGCAATHMTPLLVSRRTSGAVNSSSAGAWALRAKTFQMHTEPRWAHHP
mmetsp:Transcript_13906/g.35173  ORF Transcript_13906/g.35173 Transcript_13906/m.35173 type:complete len:276 (+) Transcript_13906:1392-2219(+)